MVVFIHPFIDGSWRIDLTAVKTSAQFGGKEFAAVNAASLVRGDMILSVGAISGVHFTGENNSDQPRPAAVVGGSAWFAVFFIALVHP